MNITVNQNEIIHLLKSFYELTDIRIVFFDTNFNEMFGYPETNSEFCTKMRQNEDFEKKCIHSAVEMCRICEKEKKTIIKYCHAGLTEIASPVIRDNIILGYIMFGQIRCEEDKNKFISSVLEKCKSYVPDNDDNIISLVQNICFKTPKQINAAAEIIKVIISYIHIKEIVSFKKDSDSFIIMNYIENNLESILNINTICKHFYISRTALYELSKSFAPEGIAKYIKNKRIEKAKKLLSSTTFSTDHIAKCTGFDDTDYFRRVFKNETGISVKDFRQQK